MELRLPVDLKQELAARARLERWVDAERLLDVRCGTRSELKRRASGLAVGDRDLHRARSYPRARRPFN